MPDKKAILVISFGTSYHDTCKKTIGAIEEDIAAAFPEYTVRRAFTSGMILKKLKTRDGLELDNVTQALQRLLDEGYQTVLCQPTHILNGEEFEDILADAAPFASRFETFRIGSPLLTSTRDYRELAAALTRLINPPPEQALCLMGHGSTHFADAAYAALGYHFADMGYKNVFVGTVEGFPDLETLMRHVAESGLKKVILTPLMVVAGDHAINDMASDEEDSWKTAFESAGYEVECIVRGLGEYQDIRDMYLEHVRKMM